MLSVKLIDDYIIKSQDIKTFQIQLLRDGKPHAIPEDCTVKLLIANTKAIVKEEEMVVVDAEQGIVQFTLQATIGTGSFDCEFVLSNGDDINLTFPDNGYTVLKVSPCLTERPIEVITKSEYEKLNEKIEDLILGEIDLDQYVTEGELEEAISEIDVTDQISIKQDILVSGTNIKTINGESILGSGNLTLEIYSLPTTADENYLLGLLDGENVVTTTYALDIEGNRLLDADGNMLIIKGW